MLIEMRKGLGRKPGLFHCPEPLLAGTFGLLRMSNVWDRLAGDLAVSTEKIKSVGYAPVISTEAGLQRLVRHRTV
jgi:hypothetical protein